MPRVSGFVQGWFQRSVPRVSGFVQGLGFGVQGLGFSVACRGFQGSGFRDDVMM